MAVRIVMADDHAMFRSGLRALIESEDDIEIVAEAESGWEVLEILDKTDFDILVLDISMPGLSGSAIAEKALEKRPELLIIILTMYDDEHYVQEFFRLGVRGYVLKKSTGTDLIQAIKAVYRGESYIDPALVESIISPYVGKSAAKKSGQMDRLSQREIEVCRLLALGYSHSKAAEKLCISRRTVEAHRAHIMTKLGLKDRVDLVHFALDNNLMRLA